MSLRMNKADIQRYIRKYGTVIVGEEQEHLQRPFGKSTYHNLIKRLKAVGVSEKTHPNLLRRLNLAVEASETVTVERSTEETKVYLSASKKLSSKDRINGVALFEL